MRQLMITIEPNLIQGKQMAHILAKVADLKKEGKIENIDFRVVYFSDSAEIKILR